MSQEHIYVKIMIKDKESLIFRLQDLINKGRNHSLKLSEEKEHKQYYKFLAWLTTVNNLMSVAFGENNLPYTKKFLQLESSVSSDNALGTSTQVVSMLEEFLFDLEKETFVFVTQLSDETPNTLD